MQLFRYKHFVAIFIFFSISPKCYCFQNNEFCDKDFADDCVNKRTKYIFYDVNPPEGFNLRRDVFMRFAIFAHKLAHSNDPEMNSYRLVLPPWSNLYHWKQTPEPDHVPWALFFDVQSIQKFAPVIEMHEFFTSKSQIGKKLIDWERKFANVIIDQVYVLQHFDDMFSSGKFEEKLALAPCNQPPTPNYFFYLNVTGKQVNCVSFHGHTSQLQKLLKDSNHKNIYFDHGEVALHDHFGDAVFWRCRRSMRFNNELIEIASEFRLRFLNSTNLNDKTHLPADWRDERPHRTALGGAYLSVHLRRKDFVWGRSKEVPSIEKAADQIRNKLLELHLDTVFIATDAPEVEFQELKSFLQPDINVLKFRANKEVKKHYKDGGVAIIEQIICSHARFFLGTHASTFSYRIQEEREILGFPPENTFNRLCGDNETNECDKTTQWKIVY